MTGSQAMFEGRSASPSGFQIRMLPTRARIASVSSTMSYFVLVASTAPTASSSQLPSLAVLPAPIGASIREDSSIAAYRCRPVLRSRPM